MEGREGSSGRGLETGTGVGSALAPPPPYLAREWLRVRMPSLLFSFTNRASCCGLHASPPMRRSSFSVFGGSASFHSLRAQRRRRRRSGEAGSEGLQEPTGAPIAHPICNAVESHSSAALVDSQQRRKAATARLPHQSGSSASGRSGGSDPFLRMLSPVHTSLLMPDMPAVGALGEARRF